jgi:hypothetical protein
MSSSKLERLAPLTGVVFVVLFVVGAVLSLKSGFLPPGDEIKSFYEDSSTNVRVGGYLMQLSAVFLLWFVGSLRVKLRSAEAKPGRLSAVAFGGGVAVAAVIMVSQAATIAGAARGSTDEGVAVETAVALFDFTGVMMGSALPLAWAVVLGATAIVSFRTNVFARWLSWATAVVAVGLLIPEVNFLLVGLALPWALVVSIVLYRSNRMSTQPAESG